MSESADRLYDAVRGLLSEPPHGMTFPSLTYAADCYQQQREGQRRWAAINGDNHVKPLTPDEIEDIAADMPDLAQAITLLQGGTPGPLRIFRSGTTTHDEAAAYIMHALRPHAGSDLLVLGVESDAEIKKAIAIFGNGPDADANIRRAGLAMSMGAMFIAQVGALALAMQQAQSAIAHGNHGAAWEILHEALSTTNQDFRDEAAAVRVEDGQG